MLTYCMLTYYVLMSLLVIQESFFNVNRRTLGEWVRGTFP